MNDESISSERFFKYLRDKRIAPAFKKAPVKKFHNKGEAWYYSVCATPIQRSKLTILLFCAPPLACFY